MGGCDIKTASSAYNLGATFDQHMTLKPHIPYLVESCYWQLRNIEQVCKYLKRDAAEKLIHAFISSHLDNINGFTQWSA